MSVYGYPREPEETGDEIQPADLPYRVTSQPVSVPSSPPEPAAPPQPLLPADPPGAPYPSLGDLIPTQRTSSESEPVLAPAGAPTHGVPPLGPPPNGSGPDDPPAESGKAFEWLQPAARPAPTPDWRGPADPVSPASTPQPEWRPFDPPTASDRAQPAPTAPGSLSTSPTPPSPPLLSTAPVSTPPASTIPASTTPASTTPVSPARPGFGPSPSMGQPPVPAGADRTVPASADRTVPDHTASKAEIDPAGGEQPPAPSVPPAAPPPIRVDEPEIPPWDRKPLLVVIAASVVLVLIGIVSGVVTAAVASRAVASWHEAGSQPTSDPGAVPTAGPTVAPPPAAETITLSGVGDVIMGSVNLGTPPNNGAGFFDQVRDALAADLVMGNLDMALSDPTGYGKCSPGATDCFQLSLPPSYANVLRDGGFHLMTLANNHSQDQGPQGYANTQAALTAAGIQHTGGVDQITYVTVKNVEVAVIGFSVYSYTANLNDIPRAAELVRQAAAQTDLVVVQMQGGAEGSDRTQVPPAGQHESFAGEDRGDLRGFAHAVIDAGADVVFGHGPHVMRGMEFYQGRLIAYSLGNFCGYAVLSSSGWSGVGGILKVTLQPDGTWVGGQLIATEMVGPGFPAIDAELRALAFVDDLSVQNFGPAAARIDHATGEITVP